jgi:hypothetical protein
LKTAGDCCIVISHYLTLRYFDLLADLGFADPKYKSILFSSSHVHSSSSALPIAYFTASRGQFARQPFRTLIVSELINTVEWHCIGGTDAEESQGEEVQR